MNNLVDKLIKKFNFEKHDEFKNENDLLNTKLYKNLIRKYTFSNDMNEIDMINNKHTLGNNINNLYSIEKQNNKVKKLSTFFL